MKIIQTKASVQSVPHMTSYLYHIKDKSQIDMDQNSWHYPEQQEIILTCKISHELVTQPNKEDWLKSVTIMYKDDVLWTHEFSIGEQRLDPRTHWCFMSAGADWHAQLSKVIQLYKTPPPAEGPRLSRPELIERMSGHTICFPHNVENRSILGMIEDGCITYQGLKSTAIHRPEPDSRWVQITFA